MAPRQDRTQPLVFGHSTVHSRLTSTRGGYHGYGGGLGNLEGGINGFRVVNDFSIRNNVFHDLLSKVNLESKKKSIFNNNNLNIRKVRLNLAHHGAVQGRKYKGSLQERDELRALEKEAIMYKFKRQEIQAQTRELRRALYKKNQEIRRKKKEVKVLKVMERNLIRILEKCDNQPIDIQQPISNNLQIAAPSAFRANLYRIYVLCAALLSFLLVRVVSYGSIVVNRV